MTSNLIKQKKYLCCKHKNTTNNKSLIEKAFDLLIYDVDMTVGEDETVLKNAYNEFCSIISCSSDKDCKQCLKEYYIQKAKEELRD